MKRKIVLIALCLSVILSSSTAFAYSEDPIDIRLNKQPLTLSAQPRIVNGALMVPLMDFMEIFGGRLIYWDSEKKSALLSNNMQVTLGEDKVTIFDSYVSVFTGENAINEILTMEEAAFISEGKMMIPVSFIQSYYKDFIEIELDENSNTVDCYITFIGGNLSYFLEWSPSVLISTKEYRLLRYFNPDYFNMDISDFKDGTGTIMFTGKDFPERAIKITVFDNKITEILDNYNSIDRNIQEEGTSTEYNGYTELVTDDFKIRLYSQKEFEKDEEITVYAEIEYIGKYDSIQLYHSDPCFTINLFGGIYSIGGFMTDVGIPSTWQNGEVHKFELQKSGGWDSKDPNADFWENYFSTPEIFLPAGKYTITGRFEATNNYDGKKIILYVTTKITVK